MLPLPTVPIGVHDDQQPIIGATLYLMNFLMPSRNAFYLTTVAEHLVVQADQPRVGIDFRRVCLKLCQHLGKCLNSSSTRPPAGGSMPVTESLHLPRQ